MKNKLVLLIGIIVIVCVGIGGKIYMDLKKLEEMVIDVKSEEAKNVFENGLRNLDQKALTPEGVIQSYEIDYDSIEKNPMGGINVRKMKINVDFSAFFLYVKCILRHGSFEFRKMEDFILCHLYF